MKFAVAHYKKDSSDWFVNGGKLIVADGKYTLKSFMKTIAVFEADQTIVRKIPDEMWYKGISMWDGQKEYNIYFFKNTANKVYTRFGIAW